MFRSSAAGIGRQALLASSVSQVPACHMATLKDISLRLKSVKNIQKITKSMKMVAAAKYSRAERELRPARPYGEGAQAFYEAAELPQAEKQPEHLVVLMTSDRGLCGGVHTNIGREIKHDMQHKPADRNVRLICVGDKSKQILQRIYGDEIIMSVNEIGKRPPTFEDAAALAQAVLQCGFNFNQGEIIFNRFRSVVSYKTSRIPIFSMDSVEKSDKISVYDSLDSEVLQSYMEYSLASLFYYVLKESATSEQSSRMTAMEAASKNAGEMIDKLTMHFNRTRQSVITRELIEIISGAAAL